MIEHGAFLADLEEALSTAAEPATRQWWERYLKGEAAFRGVKMAGIRTATRQLVARYDITALPVAERLALAHACMARQHTEDKLAGVLLLAEHSLKDLTIDHVRELGAPLADGSLADWNVVDWYCVKMLGPFVAAGKDVEGRADAVAAWRTADVLWQRRAAAVAFVNLVGHEREPFTGFTELVLTVCHANARDPARWSQTSAGWVLRELSKRDPAAVLAFLAEHPHLSTEARKNAAKYL